MSYIGTMMMGNIEINASALRTILGRVPHWIEFKSETHRIEFWKNDGGGGILIFAIDGASHENAARLAEELGLKGEGSSPTSWSRWYPRVTLYTDGGPDGNKLRDAILRLNVPNRIFESQQLELCDGQYRYMTPMWTADQMIGEVEKIAERWHDQLDSAPKGI